MIPPLEIHPCKEFLPFRDDSPAGKFIPAKVFCHIKIHLESASEFLHNSFRISPSSSVASRATVLENLSLLFR